MGIRARVRAMPWAASVYRFVQGAFLRGKTPEEVFSKIHQQNYWRGKESVSGPGSSLDAASSLIESLPKVWRDLGIRTVLDIPCGDFNWMSHVDLTGIDYTGADIVAHLITDNTRYERGNVRFRRIDLVSDPLPKVDLIFCRDCLGHLSLKHAFAALSNICASGSTYLMVSTSNADHNVDIVTGQGRDSSLNLEVAPFRFPPPIQTIDEKYRGPHGSLRTAMGLWKVADIERLATQKTEN
jgi:SAM-dependent methyltransferase